MFKTFSLIAAGAAAVQISGANRDYDKDFDYCPHYGKECECPHVQDVGIVKPKDTVGKIEYSEAQCNVMGLAAQSFQPEIKIESVEAVNSCGHQVAVDEFCGKSVLKKDWDVSGCINVSEKLEVCGNWHNDEHSEGRQTLSTEELEIVDDTCVPALCSKDLCKEAAWNVKKATECCDEHHK